MWNLHNDDDGVTNSDDTIGGRKVKTWDFRGGKPEF